MISIQRRRLHIFFICAPLLLCLFASAPAPRQAVAQETTPTETPANVDGVVEIPTPVIEVIATAAPEESPPTPAPAVDTSDAPVHVVQIGETLETIAALHGTDVRVLAKLNRLTRSDLLLTGQKLLLPQGDSEPMRLHRVEVGDTLTGIAAQYGVVLSKLQRANTLACADCLVIGQWLRIPTVGPSSALPEPFASVHISPPLPTQGDVIVVSVTTHSALQSLVGTLAGRPLTFVQKGYAYLALTGVDALQNPGVYTVTMRAITNDGLPGTIRGRLQIGAGAYGYENLTISAKLEPLLAIDINEEERAALDGIFMRNFTGAQYWNGTLQQPIPGKIISYYGTRRTFNGGMLKTYHSGIDMPARQGVAISAAAAGKVVAAQNFPIRGNVVIIDHGRSFFTVYCHLSKFAVQPGDFVDAGDVIGFTGATGRVLGPHLHFETAVGGVTIDPLPLLEAEIP